MPIRVLISVFFLSEPNFSYWGPNSIVLTLKKNYIYPFLLFLGWNSKAEDCEKDIQGWKKKISAATSNISKHNRQIKSKVCFSGRFPSDTYLFSAMYD